MQVSEIYKCKKNDDNYTNKNDKMLHVVDKYDQNFFHSLIQVSRNLTIENFNKSIINQINVRKTDLGRPLSDLTHNISGVNLVNEVKLVLDSNEPNQKNVKLYSGRWYSMLIEPFSSANGKNEEGVNVIFHDITDLTLAKIQSDQTVERLSKINKDHENFIYSASHDLKSPLNNVEALVSLINRENDLKSIKEYTVAILNSVKSLRQTINELSDISNIEEELYCKKSVKIPSLLDDIKKSISHLLNESFAILEIDLGIKEINFSKKNLRSIIFNFMTNAIKYRSNNRQLKIEIKTRKEDDYMVLSIKDNGRGIAEDQIESVFSKFKRVNKVEKIEGSGIGLFLVNRIVSNAGGKVTVESKLGKGTNFEVFLPINNSMDSTNYS